MIDVPNLFRKGAKQLFVALAPIPDAQEGMQKTQNHSDAREQILPCPLGMLPSIRVHALWLVVGLEVQCFLFEM